MIIEIEEIILKGIKKNVLSNVSQARPIENILG